MRLILSAIALLAVGSAAALAQSATPANPLRRPAAATSAPEADAAPAARRTKASRQAASGNYRERQKRCGGEWKVAKAANTTNGQKWPQFLSACNARLKAAGV